MTVNPQDLTGLQAVYSGAEIIPEAGIDHVFLPKLAILSSGAHLVMDALLRPHEHEGYPTRLFLERQIPGKGQNWKQYQLLGRTWFAPSWSHIPADMSLLAMLANHVAAFR